MGPGPGVRAPARAPQLLWLQKAVGWELGNQAAVTRWVGEMGYLARRPRVGGEEEADARTPRPA